MLHFDPDLRDGVLHLAPEVPEWIGRLAVHGVPLMGGRLSFEVTDGQCTVLEAPDGLTIAPRAMDPTV